VTVLIAVLFVLLWAAGQASAAGERSPRRAGGGAVTPSVAGAPITPLEHAHAHNDYLNSDPAHGAMTLGYTSMEADVWLHDGTLMLCHSYEGNTCKDDLGQTEPPAPFVATYLDRISTWVQAYGGRVYQNYNQPIYLLVEIKCASKQIAGADTCTDDDTHPTPAGSPNNPLNVLSAIQNALQPYHGMLYSWSQAAGPAWGPVQVVITGGHNGQAYASQNGGTTSVHDVLKSQSVRWSFLDGTLNSDATQNDADLVPMVSLQYPATSKGEGRNGNCQIDKTKELTAPGSPNAYLLTEITNAQTTGHRVRVYGLPDCPHRGDTGDYDRTSGWTDLKEAGVDYVSSDHLNYLHDWLTANYIGGGGGNCGIRQYIAPGTHHGGLYAQYCDLWTGGVPVHAGATASSTTVGQLNNGDRTNWFLGQAPGTRFCYPGQPWCNNWWAYTEADNGQWGWVSLTYFASGSNDQSADALAYSCYAVQPGTTNGCHPY
jgi:hypothetical protein